MNFLIVTNAPHKIKDNKIYSYGPYIKEMNIWLKYTDKVKVISFVSNEEISNIDLCYESDIDFIKIPSFDITSIYNILKSLVIIPYIMIVIFKNMFWANHVHFRSPSNVALLGLFVQFLFPFKKKTVKYAANWDMDSKQPFSYKLQQRIMSNTFLSKNLKALVYGKWPNTTTNIVPFFTATYKDNEKEKIDIRSISNKINIIFSGRLIASKRPILTIKVVEELNKRGYKINLDILGDGEERENLEKYIAKNSLSNSITIHGMQNAEVLKKLYKKAHFLVFLSGSEGWGKVITEAMFWGCLPITTAVGPIPYILGNGSRGALVKPELNEICIKIEEYIKNPDTYYKQAKEAITWSQELTLEKFDKEIERLLS